MFEQDAEIKVVEYIIKNRDCLLMPCKTLEDCQGQDLDFDNAVEIFKEAAEFGYNKANEWQYVSEKGAPKTTGNYHLWLGKCSYSVTYYDGIRFWVLSEDPESGWIDINDVIAWKKIILPRRTQVHNEKN